MGYVWPADRTVKLKSYDDFKASPTLARQNIGYSYASSSTASRRRSVHQRHGSASASLGGYDGALGISGLDIRRSGSRSRSRPVFYDQQEEENEYLEDVEAEGGAVPLGETNITVLTPRDDTTFKTVVPVVSKGVLEQVPVNVLLLFYAE